VTDYPPLYATVLVGQNNLTLECLARVLDRTEFQVVARAASVDRLAPTDVQKHKAILLVLDAGADVEITIRQVESFRQLHAVPRIAVIIRALPSPDITLLFRAGVNACFAESTSTAIFIKSLELVMLGETLMPATVFSFGRREEAPSPEPPSDPARLSPREGQILRSLAEGQPNKIIARELGAAESTVKVHVKNILRKIGLANRTQAAMWARSRGLLRSSKNEDAAAPIAAGETTRSSIGDETAPKLPPATSSLKDDIPAPDGLSRRGEGDR
jgi:two-component system nitrate/nitrite response regulator NarL